MGEIAKSDKGDHLRLAFISIWFFATSKNHVILILFSIAAVLGHYFPYRLATSHYNQPILSSATILVGVMLIIAIGIELFLKKIYAIRFCCASLIIGFFPPVIFYIAGLFGASGFLAAHLLNIIWIIPYLVINYFCVNYLIRLSALIGSS